MVRRHVISAHVLNRQFDYVKAFVYIGNSKSMSILLIIFSRGEDPVMAKNRIRGSVPQMKEEIFLKVN